MLITPMHRRTFDANGKITNSHGDYPEAVRQAAREENVPLIDLNSMSKDLYEALGKDGSGVLFKDGDGTHHNNYGSYELAKCLVQAIRDQKLSLAKYLLKDLPKFDPEKPDPPEGVRHPGKPVSNEYQAAGKLSLCVQKKNYSLHHGICARICIGGDAADWPSGKI